MPAAGSKGAPRNPRELKDDTSSSRDEKLVSRRLCFRLVVYWFQYAGLFGDRKLNEKDSEI